MSILDKNGMNRIARFASEERAVSATEYAILLALIVLVAAGAIMGVGQGVSRNFVEISTQTTQAG